MAYVVFLDGVSLPITPSEIGMSVSNKNETVSLLNDTEINILKKPGLKTFTFDFLIPQQEYPFTSHSEGFKAANDYLLKLEELKGSKKSFQFIITRETPGKVGLFNTNVKVALEEYSMREAAEIGLDLLISVTLKEYVDYGTKEIDISDGSEKEPERPTPPPPPAEVQRLYTIVSGDCLWDIAAAQLGNPTRWPEIWEKNRGRLSSGNPDLIYPGEVLDLTGL